MAANSDVVRGLPGWMKLIVEDHFSFALDAAFMQPDHPARCNDVLEMYAGRGALSAACRDAS